MAKLGKIADTENIPVYVLVEKNTDEVALLSEEKAKEKYTVKNGALIPRYPHEFPPALENAEDWIVYGEVKLPKCIFDGIGGQHFRSVVEFADMLKSCGDNYGEIIMAL